MLNLLVAAMLGIDLQLQFGLGALKSVHVKQ